ncbi:MAG: hypothetical protein ACREFR_05150 [Limisphaerales bacterium]
MANDFRVAGVTVMGLPALTFDWCGPEEADGCAVAHNEKKESAKSVNAAPKRVNHESNDFSAIFNF